MSRCMWRPWWRWVLCGMLTAAGTLGMAGCTEASAIMFHNAVLNNPNLYNTSGEQFTWHARYDIDGFILGYQVYKDTAWLDEAVKYYDWLISKLVVEPDGYKGWFGPYIDTSVQLYGSAVVGDANLVGPMLQFAEIVYKEPALKVVYGQKADEYIALAKHIIEKWDKRECWAEDGIYGQYLQQEYWVKPEQPDRFTRVRSMKITQNLNKSAKMGIVHLRLYRILGDEFYRTRAERIFAHYKRIMRYYPDGDRYVWNFWEPFGVWDMTTRPRSWVDVHPNRSGYQADEVGMMLEAYHTGIVFSEEDIRRMVNTNLWMWNKSLDDPKFISADGKNDAGTLWSALADVDETIRALYLRSLRKSSSLTDGLRLAYLERVAGPPSYQRKYVTGPVTLPDIPVYASPDISMAVAIPSTIDTAKRERMRICAQVKTPGVLQVDLYSADGSELIATLAKQTITAADFAPLVWDGKGADGQLVPKGDYRIRWTLNDSVREAAVTVK